MAFQYIGGAFVRCRIDNEIAGASYGVSVLGQIYYPDITAGTTLTVLLEDNSMLGACFSRQDSAVAVEAILEQMNGVRAGRAATDLCLVGSLVGKSRYEECGFWMNDRLRNQYRWPDQKTTFNLAFGRDGKARVHGWMQPSGVALHYRALASGNGIVWYRKPVQVPLAEGRWEPLFMGSL